VKRREELAGLTLAEIGSLIEGLDPSGLDRVLPALETDPRAGVRRLAAPERAPPLARARARPRRAAQRPGLPC
jgi:hypothetical protein